MTTLPLERGRYEPANGPAAWSSVQSTPRTLRSMRLNRFPSSDDQCGSVKVRAAVALAVPAKLGVRVKLPPLTTVAAAQRLSDAARPYYLQRPGRRRAGAGATHITVHSGTLAAATLSCEASAASYVAPGAECHLEYATGALRITGQNAPGYDERHERLSHLPQFTMLSSRSDRCECNPRDSQGFASQDEAAVGSRPQSKSCADSSSANRYGHGEDSSEFVERRIREILESEGVLDVVPALALQPSPPSLPPLQEQAVTHVDDTRRHHTRPTGRKKDGLTNSLGHLVAAAKRAVSVRMVVLRSYNRLAARAGNKHARRAGLAPRLPPL